MVSFRCATPDEMALEAGTNICEDIERLRDRIMKLSRMQEGVVKKMKEFEMIAAKSDELRLDHEGAMQKLYELLSENEALKSKLETFRIQAPNGEVIVAGLTYFKIGRSPAPFLLERGRLCHLRVHPLLDRMPLQPRAGTLLENCCFSFLNREK